MTYNPNFEVPAQRLGAVTSHDRYTAEQIDIFKIIDGFGKSSVAEVVELDGEPSVEVVEVPGQYL